MGEVIKDQETGILLKAGDIHQLAGSMAALVKDKEKRLRFADNAYKLVCARFSDRHMAQCYKEIYKQFL